MESKQIQFSEYFTVPYTSKDVKEILDNPLPQSYFFNSDALKEFARSQILHSSRISSKLQSSMKYYDGAWNRQKDEPTCTIWAIINALRVIKEKPDVHQLTEILNNAIKNVQEGKSRVYNNDSLYELINNRFFGNSEISHTNFTSGAESVFSSEIINNAQIIKTNLDKGNSFLARVGYRPYIGKLPFSRPNMSTHSITVSGYNIGECGEMDIQIIDPEKGVFWTSLEHLSSSVAPNEMHLIKPNS